MNHMNRLPCSLAEYFQVTAIQERAWRWVSILLVPSLGCLWTVLEPQVQVVVLPSSRSGQLLTSLPLRLPACEALLFTVVPQDLEQSLA